MTTAQQIITIAVIAAGTALTRFLPFLVFPENRRIPKFVTYLGNTLPPAMIGLLVVYCFKGVSVISAPYGLPELLSIGIIILLHIWKKNALISIGGGTVVYMLLSQYLIPLII